jgi:hypothetical protein
MDISNLSAAEIAAMIGDAEGWKPEDGDEVQGTVLAIRAGMSDKRVGRDPQYPIVFVVQNGDNKVVAVHCFQTILENEMRSIRPMPGEEIYIKRIGEGKAKPGQNAAIRYAVAKVGAATDNPWATL